MGRPVFWYLSDWNAHGGHSLDGWGFHYEAWEEAQVAPTASVVDAQGGASNSACVRERHQRGLP